jgi:hypothetical protein
MMENHLICGRIDKRLGNKDVSVIYVMLTNTRETRNKLRNNIIASCLGPEGLEFESLRPDQ